MAKPIYQQNSFDLSVDKTIDISYYDTQETNQKKRGRIK